jgi:MFS family permease
MPIHEEAYPLGLGHSRCFLHQRLHQLSYPLSYGILMPEMITVLKITKAQAGGAAGSYDLSYAIFSPLLGYWVDRVSARRLLPLFGFILAGGTFRMGKPTPSTRPASSSPSWEWALQPCGPRWSRGCRAGLKLGIPCVRSTELPSAIAFSGLAGALFIPILSDFPGRKRCLILIDSSMATSILLIVWAGNN